MTLSEANKPDAWKADTVLSVRSASPGFLRLNWDDAKVTGFGPWRIINQDDPLSSTSLESEALKDLDLLPEPPSDQGMPSDAEAPQTDAVMAMDPEALESIRAAAYAEGMADGMSAGQAAARQAFADEQAQNSALLNQVIASLQNFAADPEQLFEPLKRLALHVAQQLVRSELSLSGSAIDQLVRQCLAQLDQPTDKAVVCLHPDDLERFRRFSDIAEGLRLEADTRLKPGSVRVEVNDTLVEDLIEHRLEVLSQQLLGDGHVFDLPYRSFDESDHADEPVTGTED